MLLMERCSWTVDSRRKRISAGTAYQWPIIPLHQSRLLVMVDDDMKMEALTQTNNIKAIVTAELPMDLEKKGQQSYQGDLRVRFLAFGNGTLQALHDRSFGFFRRQIILEARERSPNRRDDPYLADKLCPEKEGIFQWALEGLQRLIRNNFQFTLSQRAKENMEAAVADGNNAVEFMKSQGYFQFKADSEVSSRDFYGKINFRMTGHPTGS